MTDVAAWNDYVARVVANAPPLTPEQIRIIRDVFDRAELRVMQAQQDDARKSA